MYKQTNTICKPKRVKLFALIIIRTIIMNTKSWSSRNAYAMSDKIWYNKHLRHQATEKYDNNGLKCILKRPNAKLTVMVPPEGKFTFDQRDHWFNVELSWLCYALFKKMPVSSAGDYIENENITRYLMHDRRKHFLVMIYPYING